MSRRSREENHRLIAKQEASGLDALSWCEQNGIRYQGFMSAKKRKAEEESQAGTTNPPTQSNGHFKSYAKNGTVFRAVDEARLEVEVGKFKVSVPFTPEALKTLLVALEGEA
jgi:hypothetical protein